MPRGRDVVLAGPLCSGKTTLARLLTTRGLTPVTARDAIAASVGRSSLTRSELQQIGAELERVCPGRWLAEAAARSVRPVVLDSARTAGQIESAREALPDCLVVYLTAARVARERRFVDRGDDADAASQFAEIASTPLEELALQLGPLADLSVDTAGIAPDEVLDVVLNEL